MNAKENAPAKAEAPLSTTENLNNSKTTGDKSKAIVSGYGAAPGDWDHFDLFLELTKDLLPVVSNPHAVKSPLSKIAGPGKTPSIYNKKGQMAGFPKWTDHHATLDDIEKWRSDDRLGICLITRTVRAIDVDISDFDESVDVEAFVDAHLGFKLPCRRRSNSSKFAFLFTLPGEMTKRRFKTKTEGNFIELLGSGQQIIVSGTHTSGARYEWDGGLPQRIPTLTSDQFEALWTALNVKFGSDASVSTRPGKPDRDMTKNVNGVHDPVVDYLHEKGLVTDVTPSGYVCVDCPEKGGHSSDNGPSETVWQPAGTGGYAQGHFDCKHESCKSAIKTDQDFLDAIGYSSHDFDVIEIEPTAPRPTLDLDAHFADLILTDEDVSKMADAEFLIDNLIVRSSLHVFVAPANGGKTTLFIHLCEELAARGLKIFYVNADANPADLKRHQGHAKTHGYAVLAPDAKAGKGPQDIVNKLKALNDSSNDLSNFMVILDTLKKFTNMIDKSRMRAFMALMRGLSAKGATIILLAHTNKRTEDDGQHIFEGTGDLRNDVDNLIYLESSKNAAEKKQEITTRPDKVRATFEPVSYVIDFNNDRKVSKCGSVLPVLDTDSRAVMETAKAFLLVRGEASQTVLVKHIKEQLPDIGEKKITGYVRKLTFGDSHVFNTRQGENNAMIYALRGFTPNSVDEFDDLADHGKD